MSSVRITPCSRHRNEVFFFLALLGSTGSLRCAAQLSSGSGSLASATSTTTTAPGSVSGQVVNAASGLPVARALVRFNDRAVLTDHDGNFQFEQNTYTSGNILVVKPGFYATADPSDTPNLFLQANQLAAPLRLVVYPEAVLTGTVAAPDGTLLSHIPVIAQRSVFDESGHRLVTSGQTMTDSHGNFRLPVPPGDYRVETQYVSQDVVTTGLAVLPVSVPGKSSSNTLEMIHVHSGEEQHFDLRPNASRPHIVTVATESSQGGFGQVRFSARSRNGSILQLNPEFNRGSGETKVELPQGTYILIARKNTPEAPELAETTVTVPDHDISGVALRFSPTPTLPVDLLIDDAATSDNSQPNLSQLNLTLQNDQLDSEPDNSSVRLTPLANHAYAFIPLPGSYHLQARGNGEWYVKSADYGASDLLQQGLVVAPGSAGAPIRVTVSNQTGALQGTVKLNGVPSSCWVYLIPTTPSAESDILLRSNAEGAYTSAHLPPGSYQAIAFERRHSVNYRDPASLAPFSSRVQSITVNVGDKATLDLDAVPGAELVP